MDEKLEGYVKQGEDHRLDFKQTQKLENRKELAKHLVAFANRRGGTLLFGIKDTGMLEGVQIDEDNAVKCIAEASSAWCNPPVRFTTELYFDQFDGKNIGEVLKVTIEKTRDTPHSVGTGIERVFYIRSGNESRPITDPNELNWLFKRSLPGSLEYIADIWYPFIAGNLAPARIQPLPNGYKHISEFFGRLSQTDIEYLQAENGRLNRFLFETMPFALLRSIGDNSDFWMGYTDVTMAEIERGDDIFGRIDEDYLSDIKYDYEASFNPEENDNSIFATISIDPIQVMAEDHRTIVYPEGTEILVEYMNEMIVRIKIQKEASFDFHIESGRLLAEANQGLPDIHPLQGEHPSRRDLKTATTYLGFQGQFEFPDREDLDIEQHYAFAEGWTKFIRDNWDMEERIKNDWNAIHQMNYQIERLHQKFDEEF